ncbi:MAG TPA: DNA methyltransferase [Pirellulales bacterium]|nr:DNA methyltransferase [Pirellulales bacterium]
MPIDATAALERLKRFDFSGLFTQDLGWDNPPANVTLNVAGVQYVLRAVAQKRGFVVYHCPASAGGQVPDSTLGRKIDRELTKQTREHLIIFTDAGQTSQIWQWVKRDPDAPVACRRHAYHVGQPGDSFLQKIERLFVSFDEEESFSIVDAAGRVRAALDVERVTKRFYERFKAEHTAFLGFVKGIREQGDREWYASLMLNRLMFIYFIQKRRFLDSDVDYLHNRLARVKLLRGKDKFHSFYRQFLLRLFHEGLGKPPHEREADLEELLGEVPYLNGGLFDQHELERANPDLEIPDRAFERVFAFFEDFDWTLEPRSAAFYAEHPNAREEINPDILGYIFEKYINQKEMGAYYTKEDITDYIAKNTIIPFLLDAARKDCAVAFGADRPLWRLLQETPDEYLYAAMRQGVIDDAGGVVPLPDEIAAGLDDVSRRGGWNRPADAPYALPTETWREHVARRRRCLELREKLAAGEVHEVNDLVTYNLDIRRFALDAIENCEGPEFLRAFYHALERVSVLDPTCGSGAFLFAALNVLEPLYEACLDRMSEFVEDAHASGVKRRKEAVADFRQTLARVTAHPSREYFIHKSIVVNNLYGVDLMEEAVEICKLRLFLKLVAQVDHVRQLEPLPDIDFNIRAGNTLVGFTSLDEIRQSQAGKLAFSSAEIAKIEARATAVARQFKQFRDLQTNVQCQEDSSAEIAAAKGTLRGIQAELTRQLDEYLAGEYGISACDKKEANRFSQWRESHRPFHWFVDFYGVLSGGGFDVVIGNPPYISASKVRQQYQPKHYRTERCPDVYAWVVERASRLVSERGSTGMILPLSIGFSGGFEECRRLLIDGYRENWFSSFGRIPSALFSFDVRVRNTIHLGRRPATAAKCHTTRLHRWFQVARPILFATLSYAECHPSLWSHRIPKLDSTGLIAAFEKRLANRESVAAAFATHSTKHVLHFKKTAYNWLNFCRHLPPCFDRNGKIVEHTKFGEVYFRDQLHRDLAFLLLNGKLEFAFWIATGDDFDVTKWMFSEFPCDLDCIDADELRSLVKFANELEAAMQEATSFKLNAGRKVGNYNLARCRHVTDRSDQVFARHLGLGHAWEDVELLYAQTVRTDFDGQNGEADDV